MKKWILYPQEVIKKRVFEVSKKIEAAHKNQQNNLVMICVLYGAVFFFTDLVRNINIPMTLDFIRASSYGPRLNSSGNVEITKNIETDIQGKSIIIVEDIVDSGLTITHLIGELEKENPESIQVCALINKTERREIPIQIDYSGFKLTEGFVIGYGLDYDQQCRNYPDIYVLKDEENE